MIRARIIIPSREEGLVLFESTLSMVLPSNDESVLTGPSRFVVAYGSRIRSLGRMSKQVL